MQWMWRRLAQLATSPALTRIDEALHKLQRALTTPDPLVAVPNVANVYTPDMSRALHRTFQVVRTTGAAFTINRPIGLQSGALITIDVVNSSGGALGAATWDGAYVFLTGYVAPAAGQRATFTFYCGLTAMVQVAHEPGGAGGGGGEINTGSNANTGGGVGVFDAKVGVDLRFRGIKSTSPAIAVALNGATKEIELTAGPATVGFVAVAFNMAGNTMIRLVVTDAACTVASEIMLLGFRNGHSELGDPGYIYSGTVVQRLNGSFHVNIIARDWGGESCENDPPNENVTLYYLLG